MKTFYLLRHEDLHGHAGTGVVAEGIIFDSGMVAMTWLSEYPTVTVFPKITTVKKLHGHEGRTEVVIEGKHKLFAACRDAAKLKKDIQDYKEEKNEKK
jgi:hypothetical protein